jgi:hypothetical protein
MKAESRTAKTVAICESARTPGNWKLNSWKVIDRTGDFFRFIEISTPGMASNQRRYFGDGNKH